MTDFWLCVCISILLIVSIVLSNSLLTQILSSASVEFKVVANFTKCFLLVKNLIGLNSKHFVTFAILNSLLILSLRERFKNPLFHPTSHPLKMSCFHYMILATYFTKLFFSSFLGYLLRHDFLFFVFYVHGMWFGHIFCILKFIDYIIAPGFFRC